MKTLKVFFILFSIGIASASFAQTKRESFAVAGECGMCKKKIEAAATKAGAATAVWNADTKLLTVLYKTAATSRGTIEKGVAAAGYDTPNEKTTEEAYNKLDDCCRYDRKPEALLAADSTKKSSH